MYGMKESSMADKRVKKYPVRIVLPLTEAQHKFLVSTGATWDVSVVEQIRTLIDSKMGKERHGEEMRPR